MPLIVYPDIPAVLGVPALLRSVTNSLTSMMPLGIIPSILADSIQSSPQWGIFASATITSQFMGVTSSTNLQGPQLGASSDADVVLSTYGVDYVKEMHSSDVPVERGGFASYNKVERPSTPKVTLILDGSMDDRTAFLKAIDAACKSTALYNVVTPEATYINCSLDQYSYSRKAERGANTFAVEISLREVRQVSASYAATASPINNPQDPSAAPQVDNGMVQSPVSTLGKTLGVHS
jgi:hypothetical protein